MPVLVLGLNKYSEAKGLFFCPDENLIYFKMFWWIIRL
jgi:hypothetical protein